MVPNSWHSNTWVAMSDHFLLNPRADKKEVANQIHFYRKNSKYVQQLSENARPYLYYVYQQTQRRHIPAEIALLPMIESNYNPFVFSKAGATGLWQLMPGTASGHSLKINWWYDGRRDIKESTNAALDYLEYLHRYFGNWLLAIAAYDSGEGTVAAAIRYNQKHHKPIDFWSLQLPRETRHYVPKLLALANIIKAPNHYDIDLPEVPNSPYFETMKMNGQVEFYRLAKLTNVSLDLLRKLNPGFRRWATPPSGNYQLLIPVSKADLFQAHLDDATHQPIQWIHHVVAQGETLSQIAQRYHSSVSILRHINQIKEDNAIYVRQPLLVPIAFKGNRKLLKHHTPSAIIAEDALPGPQKQVHIVQSHDNLVHISHHYHVTPAQIRYWNNLGYRESLHPGQKLVIWKKHHHPTLAVKDYSIRPGDSWSKLAIRRHTTVQHLKTINHTQSDRLVVGQTIKLPYA